MPRRSRLLPALFLSLAATSLTGVGVLAQDRPTLGPEDYDQWERLGAGVLSPDGRWMAVSVNRVDEEGELRIHDTRSDSVVVVPHGSRAAFSDDGGHVAFSVGVSADDREAARERDEDVHNAVGILDLESGELTQRDAFESFSFSADGRYLALMRYKPEDKESDGVDLIVHGFADGRDMSFGNVADYAWREDGALLAFTVDADRQVGNGLTVYDPDEGRIRTLDADAAQYRALAWRDDSSDLVVLKTIEDEAFEDTAHVAMVWRDASNNSPTALALDPRESAMFPATMRIVEHRQPSWSEDGRTLFFGVQERIPVPPTCDDADEGADEGDDIDGVPCNSDDVAGVEIWHTLDVDPVPQQRVRERQLRRENDLSAWHLENDRFVQLADDLTEQVTVMGHGTYALGRDDTPYDEHGMFRQQFSDLYAIEVETGAKALIEDRISVLGPASPTGRFALWFEGDDWFVRDMERRETRNLTDGAPTEFVNLDVTPTREQMPPHGIAGWLENDQGVLVYDEWDVWLVQMDGSEPRRLTEGAQDDVRYRIVDLDEENDGIASDEPVYYSLYSEWTKEAGFARADLGDDPETLVWEDKRFGGFFTPFVKAEDADVFAFRMEGFDDSPDWFVADADLSDPRQVTHTNPFHDDYAWGRVELVDYENEWGRPLQGVLTYPANYDPSVSYPMIVYHYELLSQGMHQYQVPDPTQYYNQQIWSQDGYFVFRPDIVYRDRRPGQSNVETLRPAVAAALTQAPAIDADRVGLIGHSWGGYQTTYYVTQDDMFATAVAGAPLTNLMSMYLSFYWNSGGTDARIFEISQGRMQVPWWEDWDSYEANSPIHHIENMNTPLLMMFGTNDGAVEYNQGVEFYNAARRLGKQMVMLSYDGENHGLAREPNQRDYQRRIMQWFAHYLKGEAAPDWIERGVPYLLQKDRLQPRRPIG
ncbi:MAG: prolyl oligopeptidase family serine peptidase [Gemmatimonadota bacterium]